MEVDHYVVLGLPSGEEGAKLTENEISKAYKLKALELHPDKRPNDPNAQAEFQSLKSSYDILKDEKARKLFDQLLQVKRDQQQRHSQYNAKRKRMMSDLAGRERASFSPDPMSRAREEEEGIMKKLKEEITRIRAMQAKTPMPTTTSDGMGSQSANGEGLDKEKTLKVSWEGNSEHYTAQRLRELFEEFGVVEDVVIRSNKKKKIGSALVVMVSKDAAVSAINGVRGDLSNPLLVLPLQKKLPTESPSFSPPIFKEHAGPKLSNLVGAGFKAKEDSILEMLLKKAAEKQK